MPIWMPRISKMFISHTDCINNPIYSKEQTSEDLPTSKFSELVSDPPRSDNTNRKSIEH